MRRYHHLGIPTTQPRQGERYLPQLKVHVSGYETSPYGIEWMRFDPDCPVPELVRRIPHVAFEVDDLEAELAGKEVLIAPNNPSEGVRVAFIVDNGAPVEFLQLARSAGARPVQQKRSRPFTTGETMKRVTGIGGIFFKSKDPKALGAWYKTHLGIDVQPWGGAAFDWTGPDNPEGVGTTAWSLFPADTKQFAPSAAPFMVNYRVADLPALLAALRSEGVHVEEKVSESEYGKFGWVMDPEGNKVELWQPPDGQ